MEKMLSSDQCSTELKKKFKGEKSIYTERTDNLICGPRFDFISLEEDDPNKDAVNQMKGSCKDQERESSGVVVDAKTHKRKLIVEKEGMHESENLQDNFEVPSWPGRDGRQKKKFYYDTDNLRKSSRKCTYIKTVTGDNSQLCMQKRSMIELGNGSKDGNEQVNAQGESFGTSSHTSVVTTKTKRATKRVSIALDPEQPFQSCSKHVKQDKLGHSKSMPINPLTSVSRRGLAQNSRPSKTRKKSRESVTLDELLNAPNGNSLEILLQPFFIFAESPEDAVKNMLYGHKQ